jgi:hypothetical protein
VKYIKREDNKWAHKVARRRRNIRHGYCTFPDSVRGTSEHLNQQEQG